MCALLTLCNTCPSDSPSGGGLARLSGPHTEQRMRTYAAVIERDQETKLFVGYDILAFFESIEQRFLNKNALRGFVWVTLGPSARCVTSPNMPADLPRVNDNHL